MEIYRAWESRRLNCKYDEERGSLRKELHVCLGTVGEEGRGENE